MLEIIIGGDAIFSSHITGEGHFERASRYWAVESALRKAHLWRKENSLALRRARLEELELCHTSSYIARVRRECGSLREGAIASLTTGDVVICPASYDIARMATGVVLEAVDSVLQGIAKRAFCNVRPPGHHATRERGMGFCLFNTAAIAARYAQEVHGVKRVAILDWDVHHGNGTQEIFYEDGSVFYLSSHQAGIYPGTGSNDERGRGPGVYTTRNIPLSPSPHVRHQLIREFDRALREEVDPFKPELLLISAGFDAHRLDPLGGFNLEAEDFALLTELAMRVAERHCKGRLISILEGGYHLAAIAESAVAHVSTLSDCTRGENFKTPQQLL